MPVQKRKAFYSFHFDYDAWRASQVRNCGALDGNEPVSPNDWEAVRKGGDPAIERWIAQQMKGRSCAIVLVGAQTASRPWIKYEIKKAWEDGLGVVGIRIHRLKNSNGLTSVAGDNPFGAWRIGDTPMSQVVTVYDPSGFDSKEVFASIAKEIAGLVENAINLRGRY